MRPTTFAEFWPFYLSQHLHPVSRGLHYIGTSLALAIAATMIVTLNPWLLLAALGCGYGFAWFGHFVIEKNRPATFGNPFWSLMGDARMLSLFLTGRIAAEVAQVKANPPVFTPGGAATKA